MRIANKSSLSHRASFGAGLAFLGALGLIPLATAAFAADPGAIIIPAPAPVAVAAPVPTADLGKSVTELDDKAVDSGRATLRHLDTSSDNLTIEDLNSARQTVARIDAMIEVEKRMAELEKLRGERSSGGAAPAALASAIPASALTPPPSISTFRTAEEMHPHFSTGMSVTRVVGTEGKYSAVLKLGNGEQRTVKVGDQVSGNVLVRWISPSAVGVEEGNETRVLHIKSIDTVYSAAR